VNFWIRDEILFGYCDLVWFVKLNYGGDVDLLSEMEIVSD
jgi:hypothetical protein